MIQQTLIIVLSMIVLIGLAVLLIVFKLREVSETSERAAKEWYRALLRREVERLAQDDRVVQDEMRAVVEEMRSLVAEIRAASEEDLLDFEGHFHRLDEVQQRMTRRAAAREVVLPPS